MGKKKKRKGSDRHHIVPRSRGGDSSAGNIMVKPHNQHMAYHTLFGNALPEEAILILIKQWFYQDPQLRNKKLRELLNLIRQIW